MKKVFREIVKFIIRRIFPVIECVRKENERKKVMCLLPNLMVCGDSVSLSSDCRIEGCKYITIGDRFSAGIHLRIEAIDSYASITHSPKIVIGNDVRIEDYCHIGCIESVQIGDGTLIASKVFISDHSHGTISQEVFNYSPLKRPLHSKPVSIGKNVWIGDGVCILPGVSLGDNVIVGANSVVTHSFPSNSVIAGCPAKLLRMI